MKRVSRILSMAIVVGMIAAIPASTQILFGSGGEATDESNLPMLILVNRLEMSVEQMEGLLGILTDLLDEREQINGLQSEFEDAMIEFNGTGEELDEMLATFREDQQALAEAMRESLATSLDDARDILSINQGIVLRETLPALMGTGAVTGTDDSVGRLPHTVPMTEHRMPSAPMDRGIRGSLDQAPEQFGDDAMTSRMQARFGSETMPEMLEDRMAQRIDNVDIETMREQMADRLEQLGDRVPEALREQLEDRFSPAIEERDVRFSPSVTGSLGQMGRRGGHAKSERDNMEQMGEHDVDLFEVLEQVADILELKLGAMN